VRGPSFGEVLQTGLNVVLQGAAAATGLGGPLMMSAVRAATTAGQAGSGPASGGVALKSTAAQAQAGSAESSNPEGDLMSQMRELQQQSRDMNLEMLALQEQVQQENRRFTTASNVLKARHDTVRSAIGNIRP